MTSFSQSGPIFRTKSPDRTRTKYKGALYLSVSSPLGLLPASYYTRIDQALLVWGGTVALIFITAQFLYLDWQIQSLIWSVLSVIAVGVTHRLTWPMPQYHHLRWVMLLWAGLMGLGLLICNYGVFARQGWVLGHLCDIWLGLCAVGYMISALGMRSRPLAIIGGIHCLAILVLASVPQWTFLGTGMVMSWSLLLLAELWWEHQ